MRRYKLEGVEELGGSIVTTPGVRVHPLVLAGSTFVLGLITGMMLKDLAKRMYERTRHALWLRDHQRAVEYDENLPESLARREPAPTTRQPRFGGTGALGVSPAAARIARPDENRR
jgi:hypothetical protein